MTSVKDLVGQRVFFFHPQRAWELATVIGSHVTESKGGPVQMLAVRCEKDGECADVAANKFLSSVMYKHVTGAAETLAPDNLLSLPEIHHSILLHVLRLRHAKDVVYTFLGELIIALNPFKYTIPWYQDDQMPGYLNRLHESQISNLQPHLWNVVHQAFVNMRSSGKNHSIVISGESGSGKTEACKIMVKYLCQASERQTTSADEKLVIHAITVKVQQSSPILEAFGNAKTMRNDNSSRFGKFMEVQFNERGILVGMRVTPFLLEKTRVVYCGPEERIFHVFYQLVAGASPELKSLLRLKSAKDFPVLGKNWSLKGSGIDDAKDFQRLQEALLDVGFSSSECMGIWRILAAILHLQSLQFTEGKEGRAELSDESVLLAQFIAKELLCLRDAHVFAQCLISNSTLVKGETLVTYLSVQKANDQRSSMCKHLYQKLFFWIVQKINLATTPGAASSAPKHDGPHLAPLADTEPACWIALLDIFGFEDFGDSNSFEQFCINLANEALQRHYTRHNFVRDLEEMKAEGITSQQVKFRDNLPCLDLMQGPKNSVMSFLDDASTLNQERAQANPNFAFLRKLTMQHLPEYQNIGKGDKPSDYFTRGPHDEDSFTVRHYAGDVKYKVLGFVEKNNDVVKDSTLSILQDSDDEYLKDIITIEENTVGLLQEAMSPTGPPGSPRGSTAGSPGAVGGAQRKMTVGSQFRLSLRSLTEMLDSSLPNWVRCIRPHHRKSPGLFDGRSVLEQLVATGVLETINQRQQNFPFRLTHQDFVARYAVLGLAGLRRLGARASPTEKSNLILSAGGINPKDAQVGRSRVFIRSAAQISLEDQRAALLMAYVQTVQRVACCRRSRELHCVLLWTVHVVKMQKLFRRKLRIVRAVQGYYAELRQRILDRHAYERKEAAHIETKERQKVLMEERTSALDVMREFRVALVPMVAAVLRNILSVEAANRAGIEDAARRVAWNFEHLFTAGVAEAVQKKKERLERELRELVGKQTALFELVRVSRKGLEEQEGTERRHLQSVVIGPEKQALLEAASRVREMLKARNRELRRLKEAHAAEVLRLEQARCRCIDDEEESWRSRVGPGKIGEDLLRLREACAVPMPEAQRQLQRFYCAGGPSHIQQATDPSGVRSPLGRVTSYGDYAAWWNSAYYDHKRRQDIEIPQMLPDVLATPQRESEMLDVVSPVARAAVMASHSSPRRRRSASRLSSSSSSSFDEMKEVRRISKANVDKDCHDKKGTPKSNHTPSSKKEARGVRPFGSIVVSPTASLALERYRVIGGRGSGRSNIDTSSAASQQYRAGPLYM